MAVVLAAYLVLFGRLVYWQAWRHADMVTLAASYHNDTLTLPAVRGRHIARQLALLASHTRAYAPHAPPAPPRPQHPPSPPSTARRLPEPWSSRARTKVIRTTS